MNYQPGFQVKTEFKKLTWAIDRHLHQEAYRISKVPLLPKFPLFSEEICHWRDLVCLLAKRTLLAIG
jgi:hypothetical protein